MIIAIVCYSSLYVHFCYDHIIVISLQNAIVSHESNGLDIVIALVLNDISPLSKHRMDLVMELKVV